MAPKKDEKEEKEKKSPPTRSASPSDDHAPHKKTHPRSKDDKDKDHDKHRHQTGKGKVRRIEYQSGGKVKQTGSAKLHKGEVVLPKAMVDKMKKLFM